MRIAIDTHFISSVRATGNRTYTAELVRALVALDRQDEYVLYAVGDHPYYQQFADNMWVKVHRILSPHGLIRNFVALPYVVSQDTPDVLHLQFILPVFMNTPTVLAIHDLYYLHLPKPTISERVLGLLTVWSARRANHIVTLSEYSKRDIMKHCSVDPRQITVIPLAAGDRFVPISHQSIIQAIRQRLGIWRDYILYVGRTEDPRKNIPTLVEAYAVLKSQGVISEQLVIAGRHGAGTEIIQQRIRALGLDNDVLLPGIVPDADLPGLLSGANLFVYVSSFEGFGMPVLEAMACGTPVITSNATSLPDVVGDAALMVTPGKVDELSQVMRRMLDEAPLRQQMRERGLARAKCFSWDRAAQQTLAVYETVAANTHLG